MGKIDFEKIRKDHQERTRRIIAAFQADRPAVESVPAALAAGLLELSAIWREEANALSELPNPKPKGWKSRMDRLRDSASDVAGVAVAMQNHGLPEGEESPTPKESTSAPTALPTTDSVPDAGPGETTAPAPDSTVIDTADLIQRDLHAVHEGRLTVEAFGQAWPDRPLIQLGDLVSVADPIVTSFLDDLRDILPDAPATLEEKTYEERPTMPTWTVGAADDVPVWAQMPEVPVFQLSDPVSTWLPSPKSTSVSQANTAAECGVKWWQEKRRGAGGRPSWALIGGAAFHACVESIERASASVFNAAQWDAAEIHRLWEVEFGSAIHSEMEEQAHAGGWPVATWHAANKGKEDRAWWEAEGPEMVHRYLEWRVKWVAEGWELMKLPDGRPMVEYEFLMPLPGMRRPVKGVIDSVWQHQGLALLAIVDLKSGSSQPADLLQHATYALALDPNARAGRMEQAFCWVGGTFDARKGELAKLTDLFERHPVAEIEHRLSIPERIDTAGLYIPNVNTGYGGCGSCALKRSCPVGSRIGTGEVPR